MWDKFSADDADTILLELLRKSETPCANCDRSGKIKCDPYEMQSNGNISLVFDKICPTCEGTGWALTGVGETFLQLHKFIQRLDARSKFRRSVK